MSDLDEVFIMDGPIHAMNLREDNTYNQQFADALRSQIRGFVERLPSNYRPTPDSMIRDVGVDETANLLFRETHTDFGVFHSIANTAMKDGFCSVEKAKTVKDRYPARFLRLVGVDPLVIDGNHPAYQEDDTLAELERRIEYADADAVKVYPVHYEPDSITGWTVDDPNLAYPIWERALELGIDTISVHRSIPVGRTPPEMLDPRDVGDAAANFPELDFEIVHGGVTFPEDVSLMLATYDNIYVNLSITSLFSATGPERFKQIMAGLLQAGKEAIIDQINWGTDCSIIHPEPLLEAFWQMDLTGLDGMYGTIHITQRDKAKILGENPARMYGLDIDEIRDQIDGDEFSTQESLAEPFSTTNFERAIEAGS